jgi:LPS-assembly lipoprotein
MWYNDSISAEMTNIMIKKLNIIYLLIVAVVTSSCGFHLRGFSGDYKFPFKTVYIQCDSVTICRNFTNAINTQNLAKIVNDPKAAEVTINLYNEQNSRKAQNYNIAGRISNFSLNYQVDARIMQNHQQLGQPIRIAVNSTINYNDSQILAANQDEASSWNNLHQNATNQLIRRLVYFKYYKNPQMVENDSNESAPRSH